MMYHLRKRIHVMNKIKLVLHDLMFTVRLTFTHLDFETLT